MALIYACFLAGMYCLPQVEFAFNDYNDADRTLGDWDNFARRCSLQTFVLTSPSEAYTVS